MRTERRRVLVATGAASVAAAVPLAPAAAQSRERGPLVITGPWEIGGLAPARSGYVFQRMQIAQTLTDVTDEGLPAPGIAARWSVSSDGLVWRFELRRGVRCHDGTMLDPQAVVRSLREALVPPAMLSLAPVAAIEPTRDGEIEIRLKSPFASLESVLAHSSVLILASSSWGPDGALRSIVGTGPYRITTLTPPQVLEVERWDDWTAGPRPDIQRARYLVAGRAETRSLMAESGQADLAYNLDPASVTRLRSRRGVVVESVTLPRTAILKVNAGAPPLDDLRVRRALSMSIDRVGIARALLRDPELAATQLLPPALAAWHDPALAPLRFDPGAAARLLDEAGWSLRAGARRDARDRPLALTLRTFPDRPELPTVAAALQAQWRELGIEVNVAVGNSGDIPLGHRDGTLQLGLAARNYAAVPDPTGTLLQDFGPNGGDWGATGWRDDGVVASLDALARGGLSPSQSAAARARIVRGVHDGLPVIPVAWYRQHVAVSTRITGVKLDPFERSYRLTQLRWRA